MMKLITILKKPSDSIKMTIANPNILTTFIAIIINALSVFLFSIKSLKIIYYDSINPLAENSLDLNYFFVFLTIFSLIILYYLIYTLTVSFLASKFQKEKIRYKQVIASFYIPITINTIFILISYIFLYLIGLYSLLGLIAGLIITSYYTYHALSLVLKLDYNKQGYVILIGKFLALIITGFIINIIVINQFTMLVTPRILL